MWQDVLESEKQPSPGDLWKKWSEFREILEVSKSKSLKQDHIFLPRNSTTHLLLRGRRPHSLGTLNPWLAYGRSDKSLPQGSTAAIRTGSRLHYSWHVICLSTTEARKALDSQIQTDRYMRACMCVSTDIEAEGNWNIDRERKTGIGSTNKRKPRQFTCILRSIELVSRVQHWRKEEWLWAFLKGQVQLTDFRP